MKENRRNYTNINRRGIRYDRGYFTNKNDAGKLRTSNLNIG